MALIRYIGRIWPSILNVLYDVMRHNLPNVINHAPQLLFPGEICWIVPQATVFQCPPEQLVVFSAFCVVCDPYVALSHGLECRECDARRLQAEVTGRSIDFTWPGSGLLIFGRRRDFNLTARIVASLEEANCRQWGGILIPWYGETFAACKER